MRIPVAFNPANGSVTMGDGPVMLVSGMTPTQARHILNGHFRSTIENRAGYKWDMHGGFELNGESAILSLGFFRGWLTQVLLGVWLGDTELSGGQVTLVSVERQVAFIRGAFAKQFTRPFATEREAFGWGNAWVEYDVKTGLANAGVRFTDTRDWEPLPDAIEEAIEENGEASDAPVDAEERLINGDAEGLEQ